MGKINQGILGGFSGKVGTVIGAFWKGHNIMRALPRFHHDANTPEQQKQRNKFSIVGKLISAMSPLLAIGYKQFAVDETAQNVFMRDTLANGFGSSGAIDYDRIRFAKGAFTNVLSPSATVGTSHTLNITWTDNTGAGLGVTGDDPVLVMAFNPTKNEMVYDVETNIREDESATLTHPSGWAGDTVHVYIATKELKGPMCSNAVKAATVTAA